MTGWIVIGVLVALALVALGYLMAEAQHVMAAPTPQQVREAADAKLAERILEFDDVNTYARGVLARAYEDGVFPDRRQVPR